MGARGTAGTELPSLCGSALLGGARRALAVFRGCRPAGRRRFGAALPSPARFLLHPRLPVSSRQRACREAFRPRHGAEPAGPQAASVPAPGTGTLNARVVVGRSTLAWVNKPKVLPCRAPLGQGSISSGGWLGRASGWRSPWERTAFPAAEKSQ